MVTNWVTKMADVFDIRSFSSYATYMLGERYLIVSVTPRYELLVNIIDIGICDIGIESICED